MYPETAKERKERGCIYETEWCNSEAAMTFKIFDKEGRARSKVRLDKDDLIGLKEQIEKCLTLE